MSRIKAGHKVGRRAEIVAVDRYENTGCGSPARKRADPNRPTDYRRWLESVNGFFSAAYVAEVRHLPSGWSYEAWLLRTRPLPDDADG